MLRKYFAIGAVGAALAVALGAFGAHALKEIVSERLLTVFETGVRYHMYHTIGLMIVALLADRIGESKLIKTGARLLIAGVILFSGSLYTMALTDISILGAITPLGGVAFIAGWLCIIVAVLRKDTK